MYNKIIQDNMKTGYVYKLVCKDIDVIECYVGSTDNTRVRKSHHKSDCHNEKNKGYNYPVYQYIRDSGGFSNWDLIVLETFQYNEKYELTARERHHMELLGSKLNSVVPNRTKAEYREDTAEHIKVHNKQYYHDNREIIAVKGKQYREDNLEKVHEREKQYYQNNKEKIQEYRNMKHICECGKTYTRLHKSRHDNSKKHTDYIAQQL